MSVVVVVAMMIVIVAMMVVRMVWDMMAVRRVPAAGLRRTADQCQAGRKGRHHFDRVDRAHRCSLKRLNREMQPEKVE